MGLYGFKPQFVPHIKSGRKKHTIRSKRKHPDKPGDTLYLYENVRTKKMKRIVPPVQCVKVDHIKIDTPYPDADVMLPWDVTVAINGVGLGADELERLAYADGFENWEEMVRFWDQRLPFIGDLIHWA